MIPQCKGKRNRVAVASFEFDLESNLIQLSDELKSQAYLLRLFNCTTKIPTAATTIPAIS
jgi:hypothetical protein